MGVNSSSVASAMLGTALGALLITAVPARAQQFREIAAGWSGVASAAASAENRYASGPYVRGSIGSSLASRANMRFDGDAMFFRLQVRDHPPCPTAGCPNPTYVDYRRAVVGATANVLLGLDPRQILYVIGGVGAYGAFAEQNTLRVRGSVGAGVAIPIGSHYRAIAEATWRGLLPKSRGPSWIAPLAVGLRF